MLDAFLHPGTAHRRTPPFRSRPLSTSARRDRTLADIIATPARAQDHALSARSAADSSDRTSPARWQAGRYHVDDPEPFLDALPCPAQAPSRSAESTTSPR